MTFCQHAGHAARFEILKQYGIAVQKHHAWARTGVGVVQTNAIDVDESPERWIGALNLLRLVAVPASSGCCRGGD
ncbi:hypothetical protein NK8_72790 (plasmid) [Caballeronia sp. NK8]|nr:hypothetical protein NK8_72790 [Caballeronia sp. NK8]